MAEVDTALYEQYRHLLFAIAYRMLGSAMEAEDMVQEAFLRYENASDQAIQSPKSLPDDHRHTAVSRPAQIGQNAA